MLGDSILTGVINFLLFGCVVFIRRVLHNEGIKFFFWQNDTKGWRSLAEGIGIGILSFGTYCLLVMVAGQGRLMLSWQNLGDSLVLLATWGFGFSGVAVFEEALFRGYLLQKLLQRVSPVVAIGVPALFFGLLHLASYSASPNLGIGLINASLFAIVLSIGVIRSRSLLWAIGFHWAWNLTQALLFAESDFKQRMLVNLYTNPGKLTGATIPEAGQLVTPVVVLLLTFILWRFKNQEIAQG